MSRSLARDPTWRGLGVALGVVASLFAAAPASAEDKAPPDSPEALPHRAVTISLDKTNVQLAVSYRDAFDDRTLRKLTNGLPTTVALRAYLFGQDAKVPIALTAKSCRIVYDLWEEVFRLQVLSPSGTTQTTALNVEGVLRQCAQAERLHLVELAQTRPTQQYFVAAIVEVNPVSAETLETIRRWVTRPSKSTAIGPGDSLFGSFVGLFVTRVGAAERRIAFRSSLFVPPKPPPPPPPQPPKRSPS